LGPPDYAAPGTGDRPGNYWPICSNIVPAVQKMFDIAYPTCISQGLTSNINSTMGSTPTTPDTAIVPEPKQASPSNSVAENNPATNMSASSLDAGAHSLLDLLFATTFESFDALQI